MADPLTPTAIEAAARARGITIAEVCRRAGVSPSTFTRWKGGKTEPTLGVYRRLQAAAKARWKPSASPSKTAVPIEERSAAEAAIQRTNRRRELHPPDERGIAAA